MTGKDAIKAALKSTQNMTQMYLSDLSDADLLVRPVPNANHIAWQLGHLISSEKWFADKHYPGLPFPEFPAGFAEQHDKKTSAIEPPKGFGTKAQYLDLFNKTRAATIGIVDKMSDADLDKPITGDGAKFAPTVGDLLILVANHTMMHVGQFTPVRRKLGKPVLF